MNYYEILKVSKKATDAEIKSSYKELVKKYHPDLYVGDKDFAEKKIKEINEAYDVLSNPESKKEYDEYLNPQPQHTDIYSQNSYSSNNNYYAQSQQTSEPTWSFSRFIAKKFDKLDKKLQLKLFILILVVILSLFLINLIQVKYYLTHLNDPQKNTSIQNSNILDSNKTQENFTNTYHHDFQELDDLFTNILTQYNESIYNTSTDTFNSDFNSIF